MVRVRLKGGGDEEFEFLCFKKLRQRVRGMPQNIHLTYLSFYLMTNDE